MNPSKPSVTIIGAGIAGMSAALRLLQAGCSVTVIEKTDRMGGQFGAVPDGSRYHEHAFHIFADWCQNFFKICEEIGLRRPRDLTDTTAHFDPRPAFLTLQPLPEEYQKFGSERDFRGRETGDFKRLEYLGAPKYFWRNANAGVVHWSDMMIYQYSVLDLLSDNSLDNDTTKEFLNRVSVNGFMNSRGYASDIAALLHHELLLKVFAVPSYRTSARAYQTYLRHTAAFLPGTQRGPDPSDLSPTFWAMRGNVHDTFWAPFERTLQQTRKDNAVNYDFRPNEEVLALTLAGDTPRSQVTRICVRTRKKRARGQINQTDYEDRVRDVEGAVLLAVPPAGLKAILKNSPQLAALAPELCEVAHLEAVPVPALNLYFKRTLTLPSEHITLLDARDDYYKADPSLARKNGIASKYGLSVVDHSKLWPELKGSKTVLSVLAADSKLLMEESEEKIKRLVVDTLRQYIYFSPTDIDIKKDVHVQKHEDEPLFVNTEGSWQYRPEARLDNLDDPKHKRTFPRVQEAVPNLFLAGDYCRSAVDIVSVEGAIVTGICAAHLICNDVKTPLRPASDFDREEVRRAKTVMDGWMDLITRRSTTNAQDERKRVTKSEEAASIQRSRVLERGVTRASSGHQERRRRRSLGGRRNRS